MTSGVPIEYGCNDVVLVGRIKTNERSYRRVNAGVIGYGWMDAVVTPSAVLKGAVLKRRTDVKYLAHTTMRSDLNFVLTLGQLDAGRYIVRAAHLLASNQRLPALADACSRSLR